MVAGSCTDSGQGPQMLIAELECLLARCQVLFKLPVFHLYANRSVITRIFECRKKDHPVNIPASRKTRAMVLQRISQHPKLIPLLVVHEYILQVHPEYPREELL